MKLCVALVAASIAVVTVFVPTAASHRLPTKAEKLEYLEQKQVRALAHYTGAWRSWWKAEQGAKFSARYLGLTHVMKAWQFGYQHCPAVNVRTPIKVCRHATLMKEARSALAKTRKKLQILRFRTLPEVHDWQIAIRVAQRAYPGTASWMLYISDREGGWSDWVWYAGRRWMGYHVGNDYLGADTVGGWVQFRYSTFAPYWRGAQKDLRRRGFIVPEMKMPPVGGPTQYAAWLSPLGQALTAGYMRYYGKDGCHWCL